MNKRILAALSGIALLPIAATTVAGELEDRRFYIAPSATYTIFDSNRNLDNELGYQLLLGKPLTPHWNLELYGFETAADTDTTPSVEVEQGAIGLTGLYFFDRERYPFFGIIGAAAGHIDYSNFDPDAYFYDLGIGFLRPLNEFGIAFRAEYRYRYTDPDTRTRDSSDDHVLAFGFQIPLGAPPEKAPPPSPPPPPPPTPLPPPPLPEPEPEPVVEPEPKKPIVLHGVNFEYNSARLTPEAKKVLDSVATILNNTPDTELVLIMGHTCDIGSHQYNQDLSERRAASVRDYLISKGIAADQLRAEGYGETRPEVPNDSDAARKINRRVELKVLDHDD